MCADSRDTLPEIIRSIGQEFGAQIYPGHSAQDSSSEIDLRESPRLTHTEEGNILDDIEEEAFGTKPLLPASSPQQAVKPSTSHSNRRASHHSHVSASSPREGGLVFLDNYISANIPDISAEYEVVANIEPSPPKVTTPSYSTALRETNGPPIKRGHRKDRSANPALDQSMVLRDLGTF